eukprot:TRINITY_DN5674_c0_g1_i2.p1 TRINITY_DN5674_c0_g1~~TRINITY_DN5674_c0_g1_i2.p1  ORF type:complete len:193 (+),score=31.87 TRINITY_DN5674_c0_g1_i2:65-643(+)
MAAQLSVAADQQQSDFFSTHLASLAEAGNANQIKARLHVIADSICSPSDFKDDAPNDLYKALKDLIRNCVAFRLTNQQITEDLSRCSLPQEVIDCILEVLEARSSHIEAALIRRTTAISPSHLDNFDWSIRMVLSSDKISSINDPVLLLHFYQQVLGKSGCDVSALELGKADLDALLAQFNKIQQVLDTVRV